MQKMTKDSLQRFIFEKLPVRGEYVHLDKSVQTILAQHAYPPAVKTLLSEALSAACLLSAIIKFDGRLTIQFRGKGKLKLLLAQCTTDFKIRGLIKCDDEKISYEELMENFQDGTLVIMLDGGPNKRYQGIVGWKGNSLAETLEGYFRESEQLATKLFLTSDSQVAAGLLLQIIPGNHKNDSVIDKEILRPSWQQVINLTASLTPDDLLSADYIGILSKLFPQEEIRIFDPANIVFKCTCSYEKSEQAIFMIGREAAEEEIKDKNSIVVTCDFCNKEYMFDRVDVARIFETKSNPPLQ